MNLDDRKRKILCVIIEKYIELGVPIGSKTVCSALDISVSSATVRNEMAELSLLGYLTQPHASAGRVPSYSGYRLYVSRFAKERRLSDEEKSLIDGVLYGAADDPEHLLKRAASLLADITDSAAMVAAPPNDEARVKDIRFIITGKRNAMLILMTTTGMVQNRLFRCDYDITDELIGAFENLINEKFKGKHLKDLKPASMSALAAMGSDMFLLMSPVLSALIEAAREALEIHLDIAGESNLLKDSELKSSDVVEVFNFLRDKRSVLEVLFSRERGINVFVGGSDLYPGLEATSIIVSRYGVGNRSGAVGIIGPTRLDYEELTAKVKYLSGEVGRWLERILEIDV